jgi:hypothetical protein
MKEITLKIPDNKLSFFMELIKQLGFEVTQEIAISEEHKKLVRERMETAVEEEMIPWPEARKQINYKGKA